MSLLELLITAKNLEGHGKLTKASRDPISFLYASNGPYLYTPQPFCQNMEQKYYFYTDLGGGGIPPPLNNNVIFRGRTEQG